uniref:Uncharacterized protein n=1 Tax=Rhizophora mucronata TaxID=61149 RepID=A0A2P2N6Q6_RHIMU
MPNSIYQHLKICVKPYTIMMIMLVFNHHQYHTIIILLPSIQTEIARE